QKNKLILEMTYRGINQSPDLLKNYAPKIGFRSIKTKKVKITQSPDAMYKYSNLLLSTAKK
ncbi:MAG: hypothetical protein Q7K43_01440, partial [Candidatus Woesearchaeota archaeon]|nr:hypothetical protein [Candidatus Woesearchaeota archaeon]